MNTGSALHKGEETARIDSRKKGRQTEHEDFGVLGIKGDAAWRARL